MLLQQEGDTRAPDCRDGQLGGRLTNSLGQKIRQRGSNTLTVEMERVLLTPLFLLFLLLLLRRKQRERSNAPELFVQGPWLFVVLQGPCFRFFPLGFHRRESKGCRKHSVINHFQL